ncbi:MAG: HEPN domain-containing protein [Muribaculaceae bacterium]|nr:HEPN domain-containing protein [Muribaculaceae bacterium]
MTLDPDHKLIAVKLLLEKSDKNMEQANANAELGYWDLVANRIYYSVFHAINAMLLIDGIKTSTHKGVSVLFGKYYILQGIFSRQDGMLYGKLQSMREKADYQNVFHLEEEAGIQLIKEAEAMRQRIVNHINRKISESFKADDN